MSKDYDVEEIRNKKVDGTKVHYLVKWVGFKDCTWEPLKNLSCAELIQKYEDGVKQQANSGTSQAKPSSSKASVGASKAKPSSPKKKARAPYVVQKRDRHPSYSRRDLASPGTPRRSRGSTNSTPTGTPAKKSVGRPQTLASNPVGRTPASSQELRVSKIVGINRKSGGFEYLCRLQNGEEKAIASATIQEKHPQMLIEFLEAIVPAGIKSMRT